MRDEIPNDPTTQISSLLILHLQMADTFFVFFSSLFGWKIQSSPPAIHSAAAANEAARLTRERSDFDLQISTKTNEVKFALVISNRVILREVRKPLRLPCDYFQHKIQ